MDGCSVRDGAWIVWKKNGQKSEETLYTEGSFESQGKILITQIFYL